MYHHNTRHVQLLTIQRLDSYISPTAIFSFTHLLSHICNLCLCLLLLIVRADPCSLPTSLTDKIYYRASYNLLSLPSLFRIQTFVDSFIRPQYLTCILLYLDTSNSHTLMISTRNVPIFCAYFVGSSSTIFADYEQHPQFRLRLVVILVSPVPDSRCCSLWFCPLLASQRKKVSSVRTC